MERFRILEHPADIGFEAFGSTREEVFANAARALFHLMVDLDYIGPRDGILMEVEGSDPASLLVNWLSELLYLNDWMIARSRRGPGVRNLIALGIAPSCR